MFGSDQYVRPEQNPRESLPNVCVSLKIAGVSFLWNQGKITLEGKHFLITNSHFLWAIFGNWHFFSSYNWFLVDPRHPHLIQTKKPARTIKFAKVIHPVSSNSKQDMLAGIAHRRDWCKHLAAICRSSGSWHTPWYWTSQRQPAFICITWWRWQTPACCLWRWSNVATEEWVIIGSTRYVSSH